MDLVSRSVTIQRSLKRIQVVAQGNCATRTSSANVPVNHDCSETLQIPLGVNAHLRQSSDDGKSKIAEANKG